MRSRARVGATADRTADAPVDVNGALVALCSIAMAVGVVGTAVPLLPGLLLIVATALVYGLLDGFGGVGIVAMGVIVALAITGTAAGVALPGRAAGGAGAPRSSLAIGAAGAVIGFFVLPVVGVPLGAIAGVYLGERARNVDHARAWRTTIATLKAFGVAAIAQLVAALLMVAAWIVWVIAG